jgi:RNA polymerase sigma factor (sigma-70 family)
MGGAMEEPELVRRAQGGDAQAFAALVQRYERTALSIAFAVLADGAAAGDCAQEAFVRAWQRLAGLGDAARFAPWLCGIVRNAAIDMQRRALVRAGALAKPSAQQPFAPNPLDELDRREQFQQLAEALAALDDVSRTIVVLRYYEGLSSRQIGELLALAPSAVDMRLSRARQQLRDRLGAAAVAGAST